MRRRVRWRALEFVKAALWAHPCGGAPATERRSFSSRTMEFLSERPAFRELEQGCTGGGNGWRVAPSGRGGTRRDLVASLSFDCVRHGRSCCISDTLQLPVFTSGLAVVAPSLAVPARGVVRQGRLELEAIATLSFGHARAPKGLPAQLRPTSLAYRRHSNPSFSFLKVPFQ